MTIMYIINDLSGLIIVNRKLPRTTQIHHICVAILGYFSLKTDYTHIFPHPPLGFFDASLSDRNCKDSAGTGWGGKYAVNSGGYDTRGCMLAAA